MYLKALRQGYVIVTAKYKYKDINIKATVTVAAYILLKVSSIRHIYFVNLITRVVEHCYGCWNSKHFSFLQTLDPEDIAIVSLGSAKNLIVQGGPQPWVHDRSTHYEEGNVVCR